MGRPAVNFQPPFAAWDTFDLDSDGAQHGHKKHISAEYQAQLGGDLPLPKQDPDYVPPPGHVVQPKRAGRRDSSGTAEEPKWWTFVSPAKAAKAVEDYFTNPHHSHHNHDDQEKQQPNGGHHELSEKMDRMGPESEFSRKRGQDISQNQAQVLRDFLTYI